ncbi:hypothetical protein J5N97_007884 [Dioscorea zingiberensis]|uniref:Uncharacterized protein n=1 Tax=Dioscorea zingiberensis TaxID=325984 RepID=A0A9D5DEG3_9LILI|nr:hypothetical protein J5N97_007884 [Dioscorea zingiberensis]
MAAGVEVLLRCVFQGSITFSDADIERRPYHRNCGCALHGSLCSSKVSAASHCGNKVSYQLQRSPSSGRLAVGGSVLMQPSPATGNLVLPLRSKSEEWCFER